MSGRRPGDAATVYARRGWSVFPCHSPMATPAGCSCGRVDCASPAKHPRIAGGLKSATTEETQLRRWWARWPHANVGVRTGAASGIVVIDIDPDHGGERSLGILLAQSGDLPAGRVVRTGSGGRHLWFRHPGGVVRNDAGRRLGPGLDIRGDGGYVIAPPSRHRSGGLYAVVSQPTGLPDMPEWLLDLVRPPAPAPRRARAERADPARGTAWARAALEGELRELHGADEGNRNNTLNRVAYRLGQIVGAGLLEEQAVEQMLVDGGLAVGLREREAAETTRSGLRAGEQKPRWPSAAAAELGGDGLSVT